MHFNFTLICLLARQNWIASSASLDARVLVVRVLFDAHISLAPRKVEDDVPEQGGRWP